MFVTQEDYQDHKEEKGAAIYWWMLKENGVALPTRYDIITATCR